MNSGSGIIVAAIIGIGGYFGIPVAEQWYQTHQAQQAVEAINTTYTQNLTNAKTVLQQEIQTANDHYAAALQDARNVKESQMVAVREEYPKAVLPHTIEVVAKQ
jgi:predicted negative regulator of RcsB-dependent stress response